MAKVFSVFTYREATEDGVIPEYLDLPATPYEQMDMLDKLHLEESDAPKFMLGDLYSFGFLSKRLDGKYDLPELNALAEKLAELDEREVTALAGLVQMDEAKQGAPIGLPRLIDLAYSTECCHVVGEALNDTQLGRFCAENGFCPGLNNLPDEVFNLLDFERIGREHRQQEGGVLAERTADHPGGYVERHSDLVQAYRTMNFTPKKPAYTILAETSSGDQVEFPFPANEPMGTEPVRCVDCAAPSLIGLTGGMETVDLLARRLAGMELQELTAYKALLEAVDCKDLSDAGLLADSLDNYIFAPSLNSPEEVAEEELGVILCEESVPQLIPYVDLRGYGQALIDQRGSVLTPYGLLEREDGQPVHSMNEQPEEGGMEMRF